MPEPSIAIVGSGPAGCYLAQALRRMWPAADMAVIERLPVPFGLLRYGVAPDHQGTKAVARQFERSFERDGVALFAGVEVGHDIELDTLRGMFDVVVLATGLAGDRRLAIAGEGKLGVYGAGRATRWLNGHPDERELAPDLGTDCVIIGNGNVALDLARILAKSEAERAGTDLPEPALLRGIDRLRDITVIGRGTPESAKFDSVLVKEMARLSAVTLGVVAPPAAAAVSDAARTKGAAMRALDGQGRGADKRVTFRFGLIPYAYDGDDRVTTVVCRDAAGTDVRIPASSVITAIGFEDHPASSIRRDRHLGAAAEREGLFATGWFRRGPTGTIPENRKDALEVAQAIERFVAGLTLSGKSGVAGFRQMLRSRGIRAFDYRDWLVIRTREEEAAADGRLRRKVQSIAEARAWVQATAGGELRVAERSAV